MASPIPREIVLERERRAWELRCQGWTHARIARELDVDPSTITKLLGRLSARYAKAHADDVAAVKGAQLAILEQIADEALQAWERSKAPAETITTKTTTLKVGAPGADGESLMELPAEEVTTRLAGQAGNPAYLGEARGALADARKILGIDAPTKLSDPNGDPLDLVKVYIGVDLERI